MTTCSRSRPRCRTAATSSPATARTCRSTPWRSTRRSSTPPSRSTDARSGEPAVQAVDHLGHRLEALGDRSKPELAEVLRLDVERVREGADDVVRRHGTVPVDEMVEIARGETRLRTELAVGHG